MRGPQQSPHAREGLPRRTDLKRRVVPGRTRPRRRRSVGPKLRGMPTPKPVIPSCPRCAPEARKSQANHAGRTESDPGPCPCSPLGPVLALDVLRAHRAERTSLRTGTTSHALPTRRIPPKDERYSSRLSDSRGKPACTRAHAHETQATHACPAVVVDRRGSCLAWYMSSSIEHPLMMDTFVTSKLWCLVVPWCRGVFQSRF